MENNTKLSWEHLDIECRCGFRSKKFTAVNFVFTFIFGTLLTVLFFAVLFPFRGSSTYIDMFFHGGVENRSVIPYFTMLLAFWAVAILLVKLQKLGVQRRALALKILPRNQNFVLSPATAKEILDNIYKEVQTPKRFLILDRIERSLSNLKNIGNVSDVSEGLNAQASNDENYLSSSYTVLKGFIWAIPVLGFIGTVLGLAYAVGGFGTVVSKGADVEKLKQSLAGVTSGLSIAFETTLIALVAALLVQLLMTFVMSREEDFLDECRDYCHRNIIAKLKTAKMIDQISE